MEGWRRGTTKAPAPLWVLAAMLLAIGPTLAACSTTSGAGGRATEAAADVLLPPAQEEQLGEQMKAEIRQQYQMHPSQELQQYVDMLGQQVVQAAGKDISTAIDYNFHVIDAPDTINAFATPGGEIYVFSGLIKAADSEAELMSVLSHEVAHVTERHIAESLVAQYGIQVLASAALGDNPGALSQIIAGLAAQGSMLKYTRDREREADMTGLRYLVDAGYNPQGYISFFEKLKGGAQPPTILSSHPLPEERIDRLQSAIRQLPNPPERTGSQRLQAMKQYVGGGATAPSQQTTGPAPSTGPRAPAAPTTTRSPGPSGPRAPSR